MDIILVFQSTTRKSWRQKLQGIHLFAREKDWFVQVISRYASEAEARQVIADWQPIGCLVDRGMSPSAPPDRVFRDIPAVYLDQNPAKRSRRIPCLLHDSAAEAALAGEELLKLGCASYAYIGTGQNLHWDSIRLERFKKDVAAAGGTVTVLPQTGLKKAIAALPKPCGILGANDDCAIKAFHAAATAGCGVPDEVAVVGIDNDEILCESVSPGLTSTEPDFQGAGYRLAQMLAEEIERKKAKEKRNGPPPTEKYGPLRLVRRGSSAASAITSPSVRRAREYIRRTACRPDIRLDDVIAVMNCSRRLGTLRFKKETGHTILQEIHDHRFEKARDLLAGTDLPIAMIVAQCGYRSDSFVKRMFLARTGMTMRGFRHSMRKPIGRA